MSFSACAFLFPPNLEIPFITSTLFQIINCSVSKIIWNFEKTFCDSLSERFFTHDAIQCNEVSSIGIIFNPLQFFLCFSDRCQWTWERIFENYRSSLQTSHRQLKTSHRRVTNDHRPATYESQMATDESQTSHRRVTDDYDKSFQNFF